MPTVAETVSYIRSKNAGPFWLTIDLFCDTEENYGALCKSPALDADSIAKVYGIPEDQISIFHLDALKVIKISFPRKLVQGSPKDSDMHGGQQYIPLLNLEL